GLVASLARPGGNITGPSTLVSPEIVGKQLQLLTEVVPGVSRVAVLGYPSRSKIRDLRLGEAKAAARSLRVQLQTLEAGPDDFGPAFAAMTREGAGALLVLDSAI